MVEAVSIDRPTTLTKPSCFSALLDSEECWVKTLILTAFDEVLKGDRKVLLNTIRDELEKQVE